MESQLNQYQQSFYQNAQDKKTAFNDAVAKFYKDSATMNPSLKEVKRTDLQKQVQELSGTGIRQFKTSLSKKDRNFLLPIQKKLQAAIEEVAKENGYTYIFPKGSFTCYASSR